MILGFLAKGGGGKSSVSSQMALWLNDLDKSVLAIDADHNMDLSYNLSQGEVPDMIFLSESLDELSQSVGLSEGEKYSEAFLNGLDKRFSLNPLSEEIGKYSSLLANNIRLMTAGPQNDTVLYGKACSHVLSTPLKILLPLLDTHEDEVVIVDEKAGADGVSTGVITGIDVGIIICEPAFHSVKAAKQIAELMDFYESPYLLVGNKITSSEDKDFIISEFGSEPDAFLMQSDQIKRNPFVPVKEWHDEFEAIHTKAMTLKRDDRLERTIKKFKRNEAFKEG